jgi:hypothetical protein
LAAVQIWLPQVDPAFARVNGESVFLVSPGALVATKNQEPARLTEQVTG